MLHKPASCVLLNDNRGICCLCKNSKSDFCHAGFTKGHPDANERVVGSAQLVHHLELLVQKFNMLGGNQFKLEDQGSLRLEPCEGVHGAETDRSVIHTVGILIESYTILVQAVQLGNIRGDLVPVCLLEFNLNWVVLDGQVLEVLSMAEPFDASNCLDHVVIES